MEFVPSRIEGCFAVHSRAFRDERGSFCKHFHAGVFAASGLRGDFLEQYVSTSRRGTIRGMHFQIPPHEHVKYVHCIAGEALDVVVDLRRGSATFGQWETFRLSSTETTGVYIPVGMAHGFMALSDEATLLYNVTCVHAPEHDTGILWNSLPIDWPLSDVIVSERDRRLPKFSEFASPFTME